MHLANAVAGAQRGGPGKVAVVSSSLFGTISGSAVANVMVDGWLTIPMMKRTGFKPEAAAAIEATASTGGQIMPPVMGAASFVMAEFLGVPYWHVMVAAAIPALFYYGALFAAIHFNASRAGLRGLPREELPRLRDVLWSQGHLLAPVVVIFLLLLAGLHGHLRGSGRHPRGRLRVAARALGLAARGRGRGALDRRRPGSGSGSRWPRPAWPAPWLRPGGPRAVRDLLRRDGPLRAPGRRLPDGAGGDGDGGRRHHDRDHPADRARHPVHQLPRRLRGRLADDRAGDHDDRRRSSSARRCRRRRRTSCWRRS